MAQVQNVDQTPQAIAWGVEAGDALIAALGRIDRAAAVARVNPAAANIARLVELRGDCAGAYGDHSAAAELLRELRDGSAAAL